MSKRKSNTNEAILRLTKKYKETISLEEKKEELEKKIKITKDKCYTAQLEFNKLRNEKTPANEVAYIRLKIRRDEIKLLFIQLNEIKNQMVIAKNAFDNAFEIWTFQNGLVKSNYC